MNPAIFLQVAGLLPEALFLVTADGVVQAANASARRLVDANPESVVGSSLCDLVADSPAKVHGFLKRSSASNVLLPGSLTWNRKTGAGLRCRCDGALLEPRSSNGEALLLIRCRCDEAATSRFITLNEQLLALTRENVARKESEQTLAQRKIELEAAFTELEGYSYTVSHDLRSPLRAIDGFSRILLQEYAAALPQEAQSYLNDVCRNTQMMGRLIDDLLTFSRTGRQAVSTETVYPEKLVRACLAELQSEQQGRRMEIVVGDLPSCQADPVLLKQVWINLLTNALKYSRKRDPARIEIGFGTHGNRPAYFVKDNGVGFDMRYAGKLFGVFQRLHRSSEYEGTGVGLAIVQRIIQRHGGNIWAEAQLDQGATFSFTLEGESNHG